MVTSVSVDETAQPAQWCARYAAELLRDLPIGPFSDRDLRKLTRRKISSVKPVDFMLGQRTALALHDKGWRKLSRNEPCPCGSGKKYKLCCWTSKS
jgi:SEC-C motif-containing protein